MSDSGGTDMYQVMGVMYYVRQGTLYPGYTNYTNIVWIDW
jgi:hypothetical protein